MSKIFITTSVLAVLMTTAVADPQKVAAGVYQNYTVCPVGADLQEDDALIVKTLAAGTQIIVTLKNGLKCVYVVPAKQPNTQKTKQ